MFVPNPLRLFVSTLIIHKKSFRKGLYINEKGSYVRLKYPKHKLNLYRVYKAA